LTSEKGACVGEIYAPGFVAGFVTGFIVAGVLGFVLSRILWYWKSVTSIGKPQTIKTDKTPWQVLVDGCQSLLILIILIIIFFACLVGVFLSVAASG
jgi:hypothetical protein